MRTDASITRSLDGPWLYFAELQHRVANDYALSIASASVKAARAAHPDTRAALNEVADRLRAFAGVHRLMQVPLDDTEVELAPQLTAICVALHAARLEDGGISLDLSMAEAMPVDAARGWRAGLILAELITNAARHAFASEGGRIVVTLRARGDDVECRVADSGNGLPVREAGRGTRLVDALVAEIDGTVERCFSSAGATVTVRFPRRPRPESGLPAYRLDRPAGRLRLD